MKKRKNKKNKSLADNEFNFGICEFKCINCKHEFEVSWTDIFEIQEMTHGFVSYDYMDNDYIACPKCYENAISSERFCNNYVLEINDDSIPF